MRDSEIAAPLTNSRPEPNAEAASISLAGNRSSEEHTASGGGENGRQFLGGRPALQGHGEAEFVVHALPLADRHFGRLKGLEALPAPKLLGVNVVTALDLTVLLRSARLNLAVANAGTFDRKDEAEDCERLMTFYAFPKEHWKNLRTTNVVESPFAAVRLRTSAAKRFKKVENATAVIWKKLLVAEQSFRRLDAPELLPEAAESVTYTNGERAKRGNEMAAA